MRKEGNSIFVISVQQVIEKLLKFALVDTGLDQVNMKIMTSHNITAIARICSSVCPGIESIDMVELRDLYFNVRRPGVDFQYVTEDIVESCRCLYNQFIEYFVAHVDFEVLLSLYEDCTGCPRNDSRFTDCIDCRHLLQDLIGLNLI